MNDHEQNIEIMKDLRSKLDAVIQKEGPKVPDPQKHLYISLAKSFIRITAGVCLVLVSTTPEADIFIKTAGALLIAAEVLGIAEELV